MRGQPAPSPASCSGPCFAVRQGRGFASIVCLAAELPRVRRGLKDLRVAPESGTPRPGRWGPPACRLGFAITAYGLRIGVRANELAALASVRERLPPGWRPARAQLVDRLYSLVVARPGGWHRLWSDTAPLARDRTLEGILDSLESDLQLCVAERAPRRVFVHAGVVGWRGRAILLPGPSMSGKSRLVADLVRAGATYYSDEYAVLDLHGRVHPYARRLSIRGDRGLDRSRWSAAALGGRTGTRSLPVGLVVVSRYRAGARWRPRRLSASEGALELLANTVSVRRDPPRALMAIQQVVLRAPVLRVVRGDARRTAGALLKTFDLERAASR